MSTATWKMFINHWHITIKHGCLIWISHHGSIIWMKILRILVGIWWKTKIRCVLRMLVGKLIWIIVGILKILIVVGIWIIVGIIIIGIIRRILGVQRIIGIH